MSATGIAEPDLTALKADLSALKMDVGILIESLKGGAASGVQNAAAQINAGAAGLYESAAVGGGRTAKMLSQQIEEQPLVALMLAFGLGYIGASVLRR